MRAMSYLVDAKDERENKKFLTEKFLKKSTKIFLITHQAHKIPHTPSLISIIICIYYVFYNPTSTQRAKESDKLMNME